MSPAEMLIKLSDAERIRILEGIAVIVRDQIALERFYEGRMPFESTAFTKFDAYEHIVKFLSIHLPELKTTVH